MEELFEEIEAAEYKKHIKDTEAKGRKKLNKSGLSYSKFKEIVLLGLIEDSAQLEDWLTVLFGDYLGDLGRMSIFETPNEWLSQNAKLSWSLDIYKKSTGE